MQKCPLMLMSLLLITPLSAQQEGWTSTCTGDVPHLTEILVDACGVENEVSTSEYFVFQNGGNTLNTNVLRLKCTSLNSGIRTAWVNDFTAANSNVLDSLNWATGNCPYRPFRTAQQIPPHATVLAFVNRTPDISFLDNRIFENLCHSTIYVVFGVLNTSNQYVGAFRNFGFPNQCSGIACLKQIEVNFGTCIQNIVYHYEHLPQPPTGTTTSLADWTNGSYIRPNPDGTLYYGGGNNSGICMRTQNILCSPDTTFLELTTCNPARVGWDTAHTAKMNGCDSVIVRHKTLISSDMRPQIRVAQPISCAGRGDGILELYNLSGGKPPFQYQWSSGHTSKTADFLQVGQYRLEIYDSEGCKINKLFELTEPLPLKMVTTVVPQTCYGEYDATIQVNSIQGGKPPYAYSLGDPNYFVTFKSFPDKLKYMESGNYVFLLRDSLACVQADTIFIPQAPQRILKLDTTDYHLILGDSLRLNPQANFQPKSIRWTPNTFLSCDTCLNPMVLPLQTIHYQLVAQDEFKCRVQTKVSVGVAKPHHLFFPTAFSPNNDGKNDVFTIHADQEVLKIMVLEIVDRWGNLHFRQTDFLPNDDTNSWNGGNLPAGTVLMYRVKVLFKDGAEEVFMGDVTILN
jgi:gliding motility-associated-like protein